MNENKHKRQATVMTLVAFVISAAFWISYFLIEAIKNKHKTLFTAVIFTCFTVVFFQSLFPKYKVLKVISLIFAIPLIPLLIVYFIISLRLFTAITLPIWSIMTIIVISTFLFSQLELLNLGDTFNTVAIPYLNLTTIATVYAYLDKQLVILFARITPESGMPQIVKDDGLKIADFQPFIKLTYFLMIILTGWVTLEKLTGQVYIEQFKNYKDIAFASFGTFIVIDRFVTKVLHK